MKEHIQILEQIHVETGAEHDALTAAISYIRDTSEMLEAADKIMCWKNGKEWDLLKNAGNPDKSSNVDKWFFRHDLDTFYDSVLDAWREVKEKR